MEYISHSFLSPSSRYPRQDADKERDKTQTKNETRRRQRTRQDADKERDKTQTKNETRRRQRTRQDADKERDKTNKDRKAKIFTAGGRGIFQEPQMLSNSLSKPIGIEVIGSSVLDEITMSLAGMFSCCDLVDCTILVVKNTGYC
ncbi:hypothetical protein RRG08_047755 [Elysia crispata]|uniref:Uncharacterized protein n=1 Tax=Elysia crispata TaxID=231223 RepID=A0AAE1DSG0_9GAST|nr:hypothetical protein RRG08_047755 [Elysia crispata]